MVRIPMSVSSRPPWPSLFAPSLIKTCAAPTISVHPSTMYAACRRLAGSDTLASAEETEIKTPSLESHHSNHRERLRRRRAEIQVYFGSWLIAYDTRGCTPRHGERAPAAHPGMAEGSATPFSGASGRRPGGGWCLQPV